MVVVIANTIPPAVRGRMKLWFVEPRPNVFVSGISDSIADGVVEYLIEKCGIDSGMLIFKGIPVAPFYKIIGHGNTDRKIALLSGLQLVFEKQQREDLKDSQL